MNRHFSSEPGNAGCSPALVRRLSNFYGEELSAILTYTANNILLARYLPAISKLYSDISMVEMKHFHRIGDLLRDLGVSPYLSARPNVHPYHLNADADSHAIVVARRMLADSIRDEEAAAKAYRLMAQSAENGAIKALFSELSAEETGHLHAFTAALHRLEKS